MNARTWVVAVSFAVLAGCGGGGSSGGAGNATASGSGSAGTGNPSSSGSTPGVVSTQTIDVTRGGSITIQVPGSPLNGTVVTIPPNALGTTGTDTVSVGYADSLPGPLDPSAIAAGATVVSKTVQLTHTGTGQLTDSITVTVPYDTTTVGPNEVPTVLYWNENIKKYEPVRTIGIDRQAGMISFRTHHFSSYIVGYVAGLFGALSGQISFKAALAGGVDTGFRPNPNGFAVANFSTPYGAAPFGACYGLAAFADWNFTHNKPALFTNYFGSTNPLIQNPLEQDQARELIYATYDRTGPENSFVIIDSLALVGDSPSGNAGLDAMVAQQLIAQMVETHQPQMLDLFTNRYPTVPLMQQGQVGAHTVLVYAWSSGTGFSIYDPNSYADIDPMSPPIPQTIQFKWPSFSPYTLTEKYLKGSTYVLFFADAPGSWFSDEELSNLYTSATSGSLQHFKNAVTVDSISYSPPYAVIHGTVHDQAALKAAAKAGERLLVYSWVDDTLAGGVDSVASDGSFTFQIDQDLARYVDPPSATLPSELLVGVAETYPFTTMNQFAIGTGYVGTARATLSPLPSSWSP
ncbi:hypothetical protein [Paraburkholderia youngii]|uniref:hypothetical protein n=1 Tax=Paraburkholderia youngii TaxID=2782701 RepID=UPI003D1F50F5